jgi:hypothetical protein
LAGVDGYYHIKYADLMRQEGLKPSFPYLPLSILNSNEFYDHHLLFHVALIPFTFGDLRLGGKLAAVVFPTMAFLAIWWLLERQRLHNAPLWAFGLLAVSGAFIYRMSMVRAQSLSLAALALGLHWLLSGKYRRLLPLAFLYVWLYDGFPLLLALAGVYTAALWLVERRLRLAPLAYTAFGIGLGLLVNPYFPHDIVFVIRHILPKITDATSVSVGNEWFPYTTGVLLENSPLALGAMVAGALALGLNKQRMDTRTAVAFLAAALFGWMLFQSRRFIEYFPAFALIFAAFAWDGLLSQASASKGIARPFHLPGRLRKWAEAVQPHLPGLALAVALLPGLWLTVRDARSSLEGSQPASLYAGAAAWLQNNTPAGARVFQTDWDDFPRLFYYNTHNTYLVGLDPTYMQLFDAALYDRWVALTHGKVERPSQDIWDRFGERYVFSDLQHTDFIRQAENDPGLREVYRDGVSVIYSVNPSAR